MFVNRIIAKEYARGDVTTSSLEGFFGVSKRGMVGVYQHCSEKHLPRYLDEFTFRYNNRVRLGVDDAERARVAARGIKGQLELPLESGRTRQARKRNGAP